MRFVIVSVVKGEAGEFNNKLREDVKERFNIKLSKLPAHFTINAPFEYDGDISELESVLKDFCEREESHNYSINGYNHFDDRVIFMNVNMSKSGKEMHDRLIDELSKVPFIKFNDKDGKDKTFHVTIVSKKIKDIYNDVWEYVNDIPCEFECIFDNICIFRWENSTWKLYEEFKLK